MSKPQNHVNSVICCGPRPAVALTMRCKSSGMSVVGFQVKVSPYTSHTCVRTRACMWVCGCGCMCAERGQLDLDPTHVFHVEPILHWISRSQPRFRREPCIVCIFTFPMGLPKNFPFLLLYQHTIPQPTKKVLNS